ncbi:MAG: HIT family protein [Bacteroidota bacterium]
MKENCRFCEIIHGDRENEEVVWETEHYLVLLDPYRRTSVGAICLIIPKKHRENLLELDEQESQAAIHTMQRVAEALQNAYGCKGVRVWTAVNPEAGQSILHCHFHVLGCRSFADRIIASFPGIYDLLRLRRKQSRAKLALHAEKIRKALG